ncbi:MAG: galactose mutarotase [Acutalibacter sp.]|nr:galactose mutarotase [Acutalibacter sp.]
MSVQSESFGRLPDGREAALFTLKNGNGLTLKVINYGCRIVSLLVPDKNGAFGDVVLGHRTLEEYFGANYQGTFVGRYANRIGNAEFTYKGVTYHLSKNDGRNTLHGGPLGYHQVLWNAQVKDGEEPAIVFTHVSPDGEEGYPGTLEMTVTYTLTKENELVLDYEGICDKETPFNPTNHSFFNLSGDPQKEVYDTRLTLCASAVTAVSDDLIPDGSLLPVAGTPLDFTKGKTLGQDMFAEDHLIQLCGGFDHNFCVDGEGFRKHGEAYDPDSGRLMEVWSDMPGVQLYTFNNVAGLTGKDGKPMQPHTAFCLETQFYPDSVNHENFPFSYVQPGKPFSSRTIYRFSVK